MSLRVHSIGKHLFVDAADLKSRGIRSYDPELRNTTTSLSSISVLDPEHEKIFYRGVSVSDLCHTKEFLETDFLILTGRFPNARELARVKKEVAKQSVMDKKTQEAISSIITAFPRNSDAISVVSAVMSYLSSADPLPIDTRKAQIAACIKNIAYTPIITGLALRHLSGGDLKFPDKNDFGPKGENYNYSRAFLRALNGNVEPTEEQIKTLETVFTLHLDAGLNPSTFAAQQNVTTKTNMWRGLLSGANSLSGTIHGGANTEVVRMFRKISEGKGTTPEKVKAFLESRIASGEKIPGLGHVLYKNQDPRAQILEGIAKESAGKEEYYSIANELHKQIKTHPYFAQRHLNPNVDYYSGVVWKKLGVPDDGMTAAFFAARAQGIAAHILEAQGRANIIVPEEAYIGQTGVNPQTLATPDSRRPSSEIFPLRTEFIAIPKGRSRNVEL